MSKYNHEAIDQKWQHYWDKNETFRTKESKGKKLYVLDMFPYPSGSGLHVGHPLGYTATDIYCRFKRMQGFSVLHPMGFDAFGLPAEQHAISTGEHPGKITKQNCEIFTKQLKLVGLSYDWSRNLATCDPEYYRWTQWIFLKIYNSFFDEREQRAKPIEQLEIPDEIKKQGATAVQQFIADNRLAYYKDAMVNWCPELGTVLANEEVIDGKSERGGFDVIRKPMKQWMLRITKYSERLLNELESIEWPESIKEQQRNWIGKKKGAEIKFKVKDGNDTFIAFTTRPDTLFGVTFFVISPEHPLAKKVTTPAHAARVEKYCQDAAKLSDLNRTIENRKKTGVFTGSFVINPINNEAVPLYIGDYVLMSYGTGAVMGVPAHDERDFEFARTFQIQIRPVIAPLDLKSPEYRPTLDGEMAWTQPGKMLPCEAAVFCELELEGKSNAEATVKIVRWLEENRFGREVVNYKLRDWLFSRQRYWGEPIPIVHWEDGSMSPLNESELPLILPQVEDYKPSSDGESPLAKAKDWLQVTCPKTGKKGRRETNTMPNWAGSCWYYLRYIDPHNSKQAWDPKLEKDFMPVDLYVGGAEHAVLHLLYARFWHKILFDLGYVSTKEPFQKLFNQGMIQAYAYKDSRGALVPVDQVKESPNGTPLHMKTGEALEKIVAKMSKSLRNVINLDTIVKEYGADTLRMYLMFMGPLDTSRVWDTKAILGNYRFLTRVWNFVTADLDSGTREFVTEAEEPQEVKKAIHLAVKRVTNDVESLAFNTGISAMMECLNSIGAQKISKESTKKLILILSPFAPHTAEELWQRLGGSSTLAYESWPSWDEAVLREDTVTVVIQVNGKKRGLVEVGVAITEDELKSSVITAMSNSNFKIAPSDRFITVFQTGSKVPKLVNVIK